MSEQISKVRPGLDSLTSSLTYQSRATERPTVADLRELGWRARQRNKKLGVTGILLFDKGRYFQTLEGPPASLEILWSAISNDTRHTDLEILSEHIIPARLFGAWDLMTCHGDEASDEALRHAKAGHQLTTRVPELVDLVLNGDDIGINELVASLAAQNWQCELLLSHLIEPTARALGDAWLSGHCTEIDLTIGISMLQLAGHAVRHNPTRAELRGKPYSILLATAPG